MDTTTTPKKIFLIGATGFIGGSVLSKLLEPSHAGKWEITALTRSENTIPKFKELGVTTLIGSLDDSELLTKAAADADVVINCAHADHLGAVKALVKGLSSGGKRRIYIHTSGTGVLLDTAKGDYTSDKVYNDLDMESIHSLPITQLHKDVDSYIFENSQDFDAIIVCPPLIYGIGSGPFNRLSQQIPNMIRTFKKLGYTANFGKGLNIWNNVHVDDLANFYALLLEKALEGKASTGKEGWYFVENGENYIKDIVAKIGEEMYKVGAIKQTEPQQFKEGDVSEFLYTIMGGNSRSKSDRARALGWIPKQGTALDSVEETLKAVLEENAIKPE